MAESFTHLGAGNGFINNGCVQKVDVSVYDYWTTFSGVSQTSPVTSPEKIQESLVLAVKSQWLGKKVNGTCSYKSSIPDLPLESITSAEIGYNVFDPTGNVLSEGNIWEPKERVCGLPRYWDCTPNPDPFFPDDCYSWQESQIYNNGGDGNLFMSIRPFYNVVAMYNGSEFVGYGGKIARSWDAFGGGGIGSSFSTPTSRCFCLAQWAGYGDNLPLQQQSNKVQDVGYTTVGDLHVVGLAMHVERTDYDNDGNVNHRSTGTASGAGTTASATHKARLRDEGSDPITYSLQLVRTANASVSSIDYYTI